MYTPNLIAVGVLVFVFLETPVNAEDQEAVNKIFSEIQEKELAGDIGAALKEGLVLGSDGLGNAVKLKWNPLDDAVPKIVLVEADGNEKILGYDIDRPIRRKRQLLSGDWNKGKGDWSLDYDGGRADGNIGSTFDNGKGKWNIKGSTDFNGNDRLNGNIESTFDNGNGKWSIKGNTDFNDNWGINVGVSWSFKKSSSKN